MSIMPEVLKRRAIGHIKVQLKFNSASNGWGLAGGDFSQLSWAQCKWRDAGSQIGDHGDNHTAQIFSQGVYNFQGNQLQNEISLN